MSEVARDKFEFGGTNYTPKQSSSGNRWNSMSVETVIQISGSTVAKSPAEIHRPLFEVLMALTRDEEITVGGFESYTRRGYTDEQKVK